MKKLLKSMFLVCCAFVVGISVIACNGKTECRVAEKVTLAKTMLGEVEFENSENVKLKQDCDVVKITGQVDAMSTAQASEFGVEDVTHVVVLKFEFDKERTLSYFEIKGETIKVFSTDNTDENYVGSITDLLDSEADEDAFCYLILSANTNDYELTTKYTDDSTSTVKVEIDATLVSAEVE